MRPISARSRRPTCVETSTLSIAAVQPIHVATWIEASTRELTVSSVKQRLAGLRHLFDWLVNGQVVPVNPAHTVRGLGTSSPADKRRCSILPRRGACSIGR
jgi:site-specific recombinase XerC